MVGRRRKRGPLHVAARLEPRGAGGPPPETAGPARLPAMPKAGPRCWLPVTPAACPRRPPRPPRPAVSAVPPAPLRRGRRRRCRPGQASPLHLACRRGHADVVEAAPGPRRRRQRHGPTGTHGPLRCRAPPATLAPGAHGARCSSHGAVRVWPGALPKVPAGAGKEGTERVGLWGDPVGAPGLLWT